MPDKVVEPTILHASRATIRLDHEHLIGLPCIDVLVGDVRDGCVGVSSDKERNEVKYSQTPAPSEPTAHPPDQLQ